MTNEQSEYHPLTREEFYVLVAQWRRDTELHSNPRIICQHPSYQKIVGYGRQALPFIYAELLSSSGHWFEALRIITNADPVPFGHRGYVAKMTQDWLRYLRANEPEACSNGPIAQRQVQSANG